MGLGRIFEQDLDAVLLPPLHRNGIEFDGPAQQFLPAQRLAGLRVKDPRCNHQLVRADRFTGLEGLFQGRRKAIHTLVEGQRGDQASAADA